MADPAQHKRETAPGLAGQWPCYKHIAYVRGAAALSLSAIGVFPVGAYGHFDGRGDDVHSVK